MNTNTNRYVVVLEHVFKKRFRKGAARVDFTREDLEGAATELGIKLPKNLGDLIYTFRFRTELPESIRSRAPKGREWVILLAGRSKYRFAAFSASRVVPRTNTLRIKVPDATPGLVSMYAMSDEQALLAKVRYNRLIDIFTGVTTYSLQSHLRTTVEDIGQIEIDEVYVGVDRHGAHFVIPVQAKGGRDQLGVVQALQDIELCREKFPQLVCRAIATQFVTDDVIAMFEFVQSGDEPVILDERHYVLVPSNEISTDDLKTYRASLPPLA